MLKGFYKARLFKKYYPKHEGGDFLKNPKGLVLKGKIMRLFLPYRN